MEQEHIEDEESRIICMRTNNPFHPYDEKRIPSAIISRLLQRSRDTYVEIDRWEDQIFDYTNWQNPNSQ